MPMTPTEAAAFRLGLEAAAKLAEARSYHCTAIAIRALPVPEGGENVELAAREKMREFITAMADAYVHEHFSYDGSTNAWETRSEAAESYAAALDDAAEAIAKLNCEKFGHDWQRHNDITRQCRRCEVQEHGEHLRGQS